MTNSPYATLADIYEANRPSYPKALISDIIRETQLSPEARLMEIGAGTGKATESFLHRGYRIDANELDPSMAAILQKKCPSNKLSVSMGSFETWTPPQKYYDMIYCAQAFHWLDPDTKFQRCRTFLPVGGYLTLIWYDPQPAPVSPAHRVTKAVQERYFGPSDITISVPLNTRLQEMEATKDFRLHFQKEYLVTLKNTPQQSLLAMQSTPAFSEKFSQFPMKKQEAFIQEYTAAIEENGGTLEAPMLFSLYILKAL